MLLKIAGISRSVYYYYIDKKDIDEKNKDIIEKIKEIYYLNKGRYGYRRVTLELKNQGLNINHKKVQRLMKKLNLQSIIRKKRKYSSYKGQVGKIADNHIKRDFEATAPNQKWFTDVTEFNLRGEKLYLSPILDAYGRYIVSYDISRSPNLEQINHMLNLAFKENGYNVVEKKKGRKPKSMTKLKKNDKTLSEKEKIKQLEEENLYLKAENEYLKKLKALVQERKLKEKKK